MIKFYQNASYFNTSIASLQFTKNKPNQEGNWLLEFMWFFFFSHWLKVGGNILILLWNCRNCMFAVFITNFFYIYIPAEGKKNNASLGTTEERDKTGRNCVSMSWSLVLRLCTKIIVLVKELLNTWINSIIWHLF